MKNTKDLLCLAYDHAVYFKPCDLRVGAVCADIHRCWELHRESGVGNTG